MNMTNEALQAVAQRVMRANCSEYVKKMLIWLMTVQTRLMAAHIEFKKDDQLIPELQTLNGEMARINMDGLLESLQCPNRPNFQDEISVYFLAFGPVGARHGTLYRHTQDFAQRIEKEVTLPAVS